MSLITIPFTFSAGAVIIASQHNANFSAIVSDYNGNIDGTNLASGAAISYSKITLTNSITNSDISSSAAIVGSKLDLTSPGPIGSTVANTGAFSTLKVGTTHQGDILYDNGTTVTRLTPGTSGQFLQTQGNGANPQWGGSGLLFVSNTPVAAANNTGNISITNTNFYQINFFFNTLSADDTFVIRINNDTGSVYKYAYDGRTTGASITGGSASATSIIPSTASATASNLQAVGSFKIFPQRGTSEIQIIGEMTYFDMTVGLHTFTNFSGSYDNAQAATSFRILTSSSATFNGNVYLYRWPLS